MTIQELIQMTVELEKAIWDASNSDIAFDAQDELAGISQTLSCTVSQLSNIKEFFGY